LGHFIEKRFDFGQTLFGQTFFDKITQTPNFERTGFKISAYRQLYLVWGQNDSIQQ
jgi:hypothetical protein